ncbi:MAG: GntR family transcriptional regulator [Pseudomonadota bacterium]
MSLHATPRLPTLHQQLTDRLRRMIVEGMLAPGAKINEQALAERFGVSRTPMREAIRALATEGLVVLTPRRGAAVAPITRADLEEAFPVLGALEALAGELAAQRITEAGIGTARDLHARLVASHSDGDFRGYSKANAAIHRLILDFAGNETLTRMLQSLDGRVRRARVQANISPERWAAAVAEHAEILAALEARDGPRLGAVLRQHIANKLTSLIERLQL